MNGSSAGSGTLTERSLERQVTVRTGRQAYLSEVGVRGHTLVVDEPPALGGGDLGPTPYDLICAGLASCTTITLRMYADRKGWPLEGVAARVDHQRIVGRDEGETRDRFVLHLDLAGELDDAQRGRLVEIAARCPVHRTLAAGAVIEVRSS